MAANTFPLEIVSSKGVVFSGKVESVYLFGTDGEFELLPFHFPLISALMPSEINIAGHDPIPIEEGIVMFSDNECTIMVETSADFKSEIKAW